MISTHVTYTTHNFDKTQDNEKFTLLKVKKVLDFLKIASKLFNVGARVRPAIN